MKVIVNPVHLSTMGYLLVMVRSNIFKSAKVLTTLNFHVSVFKAFSDKKIIATILKKIIDFCYFIEIMIKIVIRKGS